MAFFAGDKKYRSKADGPPSLEGTGPPETSDWRRMLPAGRPANCEPAKRVAVGKEEQGSVRMASFLPQAEKDAGAKRTAPRPGRNGAPRDLQMEENAARRAACQLRASKAGRSWKGGARERADGVFLCRRQKKDAGAKRTLLRRGAEGGTRTHTVSLPTDFESVTSTNSITPALTLFIISDEWPKFKRNLCFRRKIPDSAGRMAVPSCKERKIGVLCL